jgi:hypothetical protein
MMSEPEIVREIFEQLDNYGWFFNFMIAPSRAGIPKPREHFGLTCMPREAFGLPPHRQPGDIDILFVPILEDRIFAEAASAIEVKVLKLPAHKRHKDTARSGRAQALGLLRDGFPYVGILHIVVPEPSPSSRWRPLTIARVLDDFGNVEIIAENQLSDPIVGDSAIRQLGRLDKLVEGSCVGVNAVALSIDIDGRTITGNSTLGRGAHARKNPNVSRSLIQRIDELVREVKRRGNVRLIGRE